MAAGATGTAQQSRRMLFQPIIQDRTPTKKLVSVYMYASPCVCFSNLHLPRQFQGHHSDGYNDQWQSELQLRPGISVPSQPIRVEMLRNREGQAEPYERYTAQ